MSDVDETAPGDSYVQRLAEATILKLLSEDLGVEIRPRRLEMADGIHVDLDGVHDSPDHQPVLVEAWAHQGPPRPAQKAKVMTDALRLLWVDRSRYEGGARKILALTDDDAAKHFRGKTWMGSALRELGIEVRVVSLPDEMRSQIRKAQERQR
jgi:hypothetical protein